MKNERKMRPRNFLNLKPALYLPPRIAWGTALILPMILFQGRTAADTPERLFEMARTWYTGNSTPSALLQVLEGSHPFTGHYDLEFDGAGAWLTGNLTVNDNGRLSGRIVYSFGSVPYSINGTVRDDGRVNGNLTGLPATSFGAMQGTLSDPDQPPHEVTGSGSWFINTIGSGTWITTKQN